MLENCKIGREGAKLIIKAHWPKLTGLTISTHSFNEDAGEMPGEGVNWLITANWSALKSI